jgi:hypothetical protein
VTNYFRLYLHAAAMNLLVQRRRCIAGPLPALAIAGEMARAPRQGGEAAAHGWQPRGVDIE